MAGTRVGEMSGVEQPADGVSSPVDERSMNRSTDQTDSVSAGVDMAATGLPV